MLDWLSPQLMIIFGAVSFAFAIGGAIATGVIVVRLPSDYFKQRERHPPVVSVWTRIGKNLLGIFVVLLGLVMVVPGVPGPGLITILLGIMLLDFPGKYAAERRLVRVKMVQRAIDELRVRFGRAPLDLT